MEHWGEVALTGRLVVLEPLRTEHAEALGEAASDGRLWELWFTSVPRPEQMAERVAAYLARQAEGSMLPFTVRSATDGRVLGMSTYWAVDRLVPRVEVGGTWYAASAQRTGVNAEVKLLLMEHAFEVLGCRAVELRTHWMNVASRGAIARLGARQDGVLRNHTRTADGALRDTVVFSVLDHEWPAVRTELQRRLAARLPG